MTIKELMWRKLAPWTANKRPTLGIIALHQAVPTLIAC